MAGSVNKVILIGNLGADPEIKSFQNGGKIANIRIATSENWKDRMTGERETRCTYPVFFTNAAGDLMFRYRDGSSGDGSDLYNIYDPATRTWRRVLDTPVLDGEGRRNAYAIEPTLGPDGRLHLVWMWRDTPDCATKNNLS